MRQKVKRYSRAAISILLTLCMIMSCMTVGIIATDAAQVDSDSVGASFYILMSASDNIPSWGADQWIDVPVTQSGSKFTATIPSAKFSSVGGLTTSRNYFLCIANDKDGKKSFFSGESVTSSVSGTKFSANAIQEKDSYRAVRFSMASVEGVEAVVVTVTANSSTRNYALSTTDSTETKYGVTVTANTGGSVVAGSTAIAAGKSTTVQVSNTNAMTFTATPASGYSFGGWTMNGLTLDSGYSLSDTTIKAKATGTGTLTANFTKNAVQTRVVYYDNSKTSWTTPYAQAYTGSTQYLGAAPGTAMTLFDADNKVWAINVPVDATTIVFSGDSGSPCSPQEIPTGYTGPEFYDYTGTAGTGAWKKYTSPLLDNEKNATLATETANNKDLYTNINATFFDYFTDHEVNGSWYSSIKYSDAWIDPDNSPKADDKKDPSYWSFINRNPYTIFNQQLSAYANANNVTSPLYFGSFIEDGYRNPGYYRSGMLVNGDLINDSNTLGDNRTTGNNSRALPGLAADTLTAGNIYYSSGKKMELFDKEWLLTRTNENQTPSLSANRIYFDPGQFNQHDSKYDSWSDNGAKFRILQYSGSDWWDNKYLNYDTNIGIYYFDLHDSCQKFKICRQNPSNNGEFDNRNGTVNNGWNYIEINTAAANAKGKLYRITGWNNYSTIDFNGAYSDYGSDNDKTLAEIVNSKFPVRKKTQDYHDYYEFDSYNAQDNIWFENLTTTPVLHYGEGSANGVKNGYNADYGFFPFDKHGNNDGYGKDLAFGMKLEINFTLGKNGQIKGTDDLLHDQKFDFSGDDDLWVYIDDQLVLDLGGDHSKTIGTINFNDRSLTYSPDPNTTLGSKKTTFTIDNNDTSKVHKMTLFYLERGMQESNLKFGFSFIPVANQFIATESMSNEGVNPALQPDVDSARTNDKITVTHETAKNVDENNPDQASYSLAAGKDYKLKGDPSTQHTGDTGTYNLGNGGKATFVAQFDDGAGEDEPSSSSQPDYFKLTTTSASGNVFKYNTVLNSVTDLVMEQHVTQLGTDKNIFKFRSLKTPKNSLDATDIQADFVSTISTKNIIISKSILGYSDPYPYKDFTVHVQLDIDGDGATYGYKNYALKYIKNGVESKMTDDGTFTLKQDEVAIIQGIPEGANVKISEENVASLSDPHYQHLSTEVLGNDGNTVTSAASGQTAEFTLNDDVTAEITNKPRLQDITVTKQTDVDDYDSEFKIKIETSPNNSTWTAKTGTLYGNNHNNAPIDRTDTGGFYTVHKGDTLFIRNIPEDNYVRVTESKPTSANYDFTKSAVTVDGRTVTTDALTDTTFKQDSDANNVFGWYQVKAANNNVIVDNKVQKQTFTIQKLMATGSAAETGNFTIRVETRTDSSNWTALANAAFTTTDTTRGTNGTGTLNGKGETTIKADEILTFTNLVNVNTYIRVAEAKAMPLDNSYDSIAATVGGSTADVTTYSDTDWQGGYFQLTDAANVIITNNKVHRRTITITKTTTAAHDVAAKFRIRIQTSPDGKDWTDYHTDISATLGRTPSKVSANVVTEGSVYEYLIQKDQVFTLSLPEGMYVRVTENDGVTTTGTDYDVNNYYNYNSTVVKEQDDGASAPDRGNAYSSGNYKGSTYKIGTKNAQFIIKNDPIMETVTVIKNTDFYEDSSTFELEAKIKPQYAGNDDDIVDNDGLVKVLATDPNWTAPSPAPSDGKYTIKKTGSIKFSVPKGTRLKVTETSNFGPSQITGKQRFTFDKMVLDTDTASTPAIEQSNGRNFLVDGARTLTVYNKVMKNNVTIQKKFVDSDGSSASVHKIKVFARKNGISGDYYGTEYASNPSNDDRIKYTTSLDSTEQYLNGGAAGDEITIHGNETITLNSLYVGSYITVQETEIGAGYRFNRIDVSGYADSTNTVQFPGGVPSGVSIPAKTYDATKKTVSFQTRDAAAAVEVINEKLPLYQIKYKYEGYSATTYLNTTDKDNNHRVVGAERFFVQSGYITETELKDWFTVTETSTGSIGTIAFKNIESRTSFLSAHAPYEDDFMMDLKWDGNTVSTPVYTPATKTLSLETKATSDPHRTVNVYFKLPYDVNNETLEPSSETPVMITAVQHPMTTQYGNWVTTNGEYKNEETADFVTAPLTLENGQHFQYWQITSAKTTKRDTAVDSKRCYYDQFNMTMYQDCYVEPVYEASPADFDPSARSLADTQNGEARISFIENSRNQWNEKGGGAGMTGDRLQAGDRIYSDFLLTFGYQDRLLNTTNHGGVSQAGFVLEQVRKLDTDAQGKYFTRKASEYAAEYSGTSMDTLKTNVRSYIGGTAVSGFVAKPTIDLSGLDNKNQTKYSFNMKNKAYGDLAEGTAKNYVYRAYSYLKVGNDIVVSDPVYFTIYDMASIELGQTDAQGGQS